MTVLRTFMSVVAVVLLLSSCGTEPEPILFGKDACEHCRMTIMDPKFGAELVTSKGKVFKFDDVNCMVHLGKGLPDGLDGAAHLLISDMSNPGQLIPVKEAFMLRSEEVRSPMGSRVAAFSVEADRDAKLTEWGGETIDWAGIRAVYE